MQLLKTIYTVDNMKLISVTEQLLVHMEYSLRSTLQEIQKPEDRRVLHSEEKCTVNAILSREQNIFVR